MNSDFIQLLNEVAKAKVLGFGAADFEICKTAFDGNDGVIIRIMLLDLDMSKPIEVINYLSNLYNNACGLIL